MNDPLAVEPLRLRRVPMLCAATSFAAGELLARHWQPTLLLALCTALLSGLTILSLVCARRIALIPALALWALVGCWCAQIQQPLTEHRALQSYADGLSRNVRGRVVRVRVLPAQQPDTEQPLHPWQIELGGWETDTNPPLQSIDLDIAAIEEMTPDTDILRPNSGGVRVLLTGGTLPLHCGDLVEIPLRLRTPDVYRDPGAFSYATQLLSEGIDLTASSKSDRVTLLGNAAPSLRCRLSAMQTWAASRLDAFFSSQAPLTYFVEQAKGQLELAATGERNGFENLFQGTVVPKGSVLGDVVLEGYRQLFADGTYAAIMKKWGLEGNMLPAPGRNLAGQK